MGDPWRRRCPEGHCDWSPRRDGYYCKVCEQRYDELVDLLEEDLDDVTDERELPDPPFSAGKPREATAYHTARCGAVKQQPRRERIRSLSENEIRYHDLSHCEHCRSIELPDQFVMKSEHPVYHTRDCQLVDETAAARAVSDRIISALDLSECQFCAGTAETVAAEHRAVVADD